jgi:hypothetical protein
MPKCDLINLFISFFDIMSLMNNKLGLQNMKTKLYFLRSILPPAVKDESPCISGGRGKWESGFWI